MNCLHSFRKKNKFESNMNVCENKDFCNVVMSSEEFNTLEYYHYCTSNKTSFIIYADLESLIGKIDGCKNNREKVIYDKSK